MSWNYRLVKYIYSNGDTQYAIHEVFYNKKDEPDGLQSTPTYPVSLLDHIDKEETEQDLKLGYIRIMRDYLRALSKRTLVFDEESNKFLDDEMTIFYEFDVGDMFGNL